MYYFSKQFLDGLKSKSENFQNKFYEIMDEISAYFDGKEERRDFQKYIEENHSYSEPGNILYSSKLLLCGREAEKEDKVIKAEVNHHLLGLFEDCSAAEAMVEVPHIIVCVSAPDECFVDEDMEFIRTLLSFERVCRGHSPVATTTILNDTENNRGISCYVAALK